MLINEQLNSLVAQHGLFAVLDALSGLCGQLAEREPSKDWHEAELAVDAAASRVLDCKL